MSPIDIHKEQQFAIFALLGTYRRLERHGILAAANHTLLLATRIALKWKIQDRPGRSSRGCFYLDVERAHHEAVDRLCRSLAPSPEVVQ